MSAQPKRRRLEVEDIGEVTVVAPAGALMVSTGGEGVTVSVTLASLAAPSESVTWPK